MDIRYIYTDSIYALSLEQINFLNLCFFTIGGGSMRFKARTKP